MTLTHAFNHRQESPVVISRILPAECLSGDRLALFLRNHHLECQLSGSPVCLDDLVFYKEKCRPPDASMLSHGFHELRPTLASLDLLRGAKPKVISEALGHSSVAFTMNTYSYIISGMKEDMMALLDDVIPSGTRRQGQASNIV